VALGGAVVIVALLLLVVLVDISRPALAALGLVRFLTSTDWDPVQESFGALPFLYGTLVTSAVALLLALPVGVGLALFLTQMAGGAARRIVGFSLELLAGIPSVVFGLWGLFVLVPLLRTHVEPFLGKTLGFLPLFKGPPIGIGFLAAGVLLAVMVLPTIASVSIEVLKTVPSPLREAALALGATRWEAIRLSVLPWSWPGILGAAVLGLGRALGETMAATMVIGNNPQIVTSLFAPGYTLAAVIANEFAEATNDIHLGSLAALGLLLFGVTLLLNGLARMLVHAVSRGPRMAA
jgi:phosphate transport system permease protein